MLSIPTATAAALSRPETGGTHATGQSDDFDLVYLGMLNHSMRYYETADLSHRFASDATRPLETRVRYAIGESGAASMAGDYQRFVAALQFASSLASQLPASDGKETLLLWIDWMTLLLDKWKMVRSDKAKTRSLAERLRSLQSRAFRAGHHDLRDLCEQEIVALSNKPDRQPKLGSHSQSGAIFQQIGNYVGQVTALHTRVVRTKSVLLARKLEKHIPTMEVFGLPPWRLHQTLIEFETDPSKKQERFDRFLSSMSKCQFHPDYADQMLAAAQKALARPKAAKRCDRN